MEPDFYVSVVVAFNGVMNNHNASPSAYRVGRNGNKVELIYKEIWGYCLGTTLSGVRPVRLSRSWGGQEISCKFAYQLIATPFISMASAVSPGNTGKTLAALRKTVGSLFIENAPGHHNQGR